MKKVLSRILGETKSWWYRRCLDADEKRGTGQRERERNRSRETERKRKRDIEIKGERKREEREKKERVRERKKVDWKTTFFSPFPPFVLWDNGETVERKSFGEQNKHIRLF